MADQDQIKGAGKEAMGNLKEGAGKLTGDTSLEAKGKFEQTEGKVQGKVGDVKDALKG